MTLTCRCGGNALSSSSCGKEEQEECWHTKQQRKGEDLDERSSILNGQSSLMICWNCYRLPSFMRALQKWLFSFPCYRIRPSSTGRTTPFSSLASSKWCFLRQYQLVIVDGRTSLFQSQAQSLLCWSSSFLRSVDKQQGALWKDLSAGLQPYVSHPW